MPRVKITGLEIEKVKEISKGMVDDLQQIIDCPRDAIQGIRDFIPTRKKIEYLNQLLKVGFHSVDFGRCFSICPLYLNPNGVRGLPRGIR